MSTDFIPSPDDQFDGFFTALNTYAQANPMELGLTSSDTTNLATAHTALGGELGHLAGRTETITTRS